MKPVHKKIALWSGLVVTVAIGMSIMLNATRVEAPPIPIPKQETKDADADAEKAVERKPEPVETAAAAVIEDLQMLVVGGKAPDGGDAPDPVAVAEVYRADQADLDKLLAAGATIDKSTTDRIATLKVSLQRREAGYAPVKPFTPFRPEGDVSPPKAAPVAAADAFVMTRTPQVPNRVVQPAPVPVKDLDDDAAPKAPPAVKPAPVSSSRIILAPSAPPAVPKGADNGLADFIGK